MSFVKRLTLYQMTKFQTSPDKTCRHNTINVAKKLKFLYRREEDIVGKEETAANQHFLLFPQCFQKSSLEARIVWQRVTSVSPEEDKKWCSVGQQSESLKCAV